MILEHPSDEENGYHDENQDGGEGDAVHYVAVT